MLCSAKWLKFIELPLQVFFFRRRSGVFGSPERKAPLVRSNFALLFQPATCCHRAPRLAEFPNNTFFFPIISPQRAFDTVSRFDLKAIALLPAQQTPSFPLEAHSFPPAQMSRIPLLSRFAIEFILPQGHFAPFAASPDIGSPVGGEVERGEVVWASA